jgi:hypothetical protein
MSHALVHSRAPRQHAGPSTRNPVTGPHGVSIAPPKYGIDFVDRQQSAASGTPPSAAAIQRQSVDGRRAPLREHANHTGLPDSLKAGIETLSGLSLDAVHVHYNSTKPRRLEALAYTQGTDIYVGPGQEKHLPHEAWHVVQQAQGRVRPTIQAKGVGINDDAALEHEADVMGARAVHDAPAIPRHLRPVTTSATAQCMRARLRKQEKREPTQDEIAEVTESARARSTALRGHGRKPHGRRTEVPQERQERQADADIENAIEQAIQL